MKQTILFVALGAVAFGAAAQEVGHVISSTPVVQQVAVPRQVCNNVPVQPQTSGGGGLLGALAGGALGTQIGGGLGRAAAVGIGAVAGAIVGNNIEAQNQQAQVMPQCVTENTYENRTVAYNVTYEYAGRQYTTQLPYDPGQTVRLSVSAQGSNDYYQQAPVQAQGNVVVAPPVQTVAAVGAPVVYPVAAPVYAYPYPAYGYPAYRPYYPPVSLSLGFGYVWGGHRHWR